MNKKTIQTLNVDHKRVLVRVDFNVPTQNGVITDETRILEAIPTIRYLLEQNAKVILCSHLGRPKGKIVLNYSLEPVAKKLKEFLKSNVLFVENCIGEEVKNAVKQLKPREVLLLENLRFHEEEEKNEKSFAQELASMADCFVQDAFGAVHRAHASTAAITKFLPSAAGFLLQKEMNALRKILNSPARPLIAILGGAKVSDKIGVIQSLATQADYIVIGGAMAYTFLKVQGFRVGNSLVEEDKLDLANDILKNGKKLNLPVDHVILKDHECSAGASPRVSCKNGTERKIETTKDQNIRDGWAGVDVGPQTIKQIQSLVQNAKTIFWNGPLGIFEIQEFGAGTLECARAIANATKRGAYSVIGGGDSIAALNKTGASNSISHISTGGGASLEFLEGQKLPGIEALPNEKGKDEG